MAFALGLRPVFVRRPGVKNLVVVQQLYIAGFELQIQSDWITACQFIQEIECLDLFGPQSGHMVVALRGVNKVPRINTGDFAGVTMKHCKLVGFGLALGNLTFSIHSKRLKQHFYKIGSASRYFMIDRRG